MYQQWNLVTFESGRFFCTVYSFLGIRGFECQFVVTFMSLLSTAGTEKNTLSNCAMTHFCAAAIWCSQFEICRPSLRVWQNAVNNFSFLIIFTQLFLERNVTSRSCKTKALFIAINYSWWLRCGTVKLHLHFCNLKQ